MSSSSTFYVTGGTLRGDAPSYVERQADRDLFHALLRGEFSYVLTSRQMGKSSLMVRTASRLREKGINVIVLDLTAIGQNLTPEQWYDGLIIRIGHQLELEDELDEFWRTQERMSPVQRWMAAIRDIILAQRPGPLVIFVDEIDTVRSLPFPTDEFFAALRECYNRRSEDREFHRLTFCLLGVATPSDLIRNSQTTPFNVGHRIELSDFTPGEAAPLANGLGREAKAAAHILERILHWTHGHPYLTQRLCQEVASDPSVKGASGVDTLCDTLFLSNRARERDDNLLFVRERLLRTELDLSTLLDLYGKVLAGKAVPDDETNPLVSHLRLSGIVRVANGRLRVRNRIYERVFDRKWTLANTPDQELRRQREAFRKGILRGAAYASIVVLAGIFLFRFVQKQLLALRINRALSQVGAVYHNLNSYQDTALIQVDIVMPGTKVVTSGTVTFAMERPNKLNLQVHMRMGIGESEIQVVSDGKKLWLYSPLSNEYIEKSAPGSLEAIYREAENLQDTELPRPLYERIGSTNVQEAFARNAKDIQFVRQEGLSGHHNYVLKWQAGSQIPVVAWLDADEGLFRQFVTDLSSVATETQVPDLSGAGFRRVTLNGFVTTVTHQDIKLNPRLPPETFSFAPPQQARLVERIQSPRRSAVRQTPIEAPPKFDTTRLSSMIPPRPAGARPELIDLTKFYNAPLTESWHSNRPGNDLAPLPTGIQTLADTQFDVRGVVQLAGSSADYLKQLYRERMDNISVSLKCRRLSFLHATAWTVKDGTPIGSYLIHYANGQQRVAPIIFGFDVRDWWSQAGEPNAVDGPVVAWKGHNEATQSAGVFNRLFKSTWQNPLPDVEIRSIDYISSMTPSAPFLIAITAEP